MAGVALCILRHSGALPSKLMVSCRQVEARRCCEYHGEVCAGMRTSDELDVPCRY